MQCKSTGNPCKKVARHEYDGKHVCTTHLKSIKANDDCPICLQPMFSSTRSNACENGHYYHTQCLYKWVMSESQKRDMCPTCNCTIRHEVLYKIFKSYNENRLMELYKLSPQRYRSISTIFDNMIKAAGDTTPDDLPNLIQSYYQVAVMPDEYRTYIITQFHDFVQNMIIYQNT